MSSAKPDKARYPHHLNALIWKVQTLNVNVASLRYRCLLPLKYLSKLANKARIKQVIVGGTDPINTPLENTAIIFVKSFLDRDVETCQQAHQSGALIILDLCDNIFIPNYATGNDYVPADNFKQMAIYASAIVTTGEALKEQVTQAIAPFNLTLPIVVIPDASETLADIDETFRATRRQRLVSLRLRPIARRVQSTYGKTVWAIKTVLRPAVRKGKDTLRIPREQTEENDRLVNEKAIALLSGRWVDALPIEKQQSIAARKQKKATAKDKVIVQPTPWIPQKWPSAPAGASTILWFGNHGAKYGSFGMEGILDAAPAIEKLSREIPLRLVVVSNSLSKYQRYIQPLPFKTSYLRWHPKAIYPYIRASDVTIIPNSQSAYSICKSANRAVLSLSQGTPVVASSTPALDLFNGCVALDNWEQGLRQYLLQPLLAEQHVAQAKQAIAQNLSGEKIAQQWLDLLETISQSKLSS